ncbi:MAG: ABC transporter ATP-binding protein [Thermodesulfobacteriota bacterium]|nr:ABC transporter ATP-binding protein [Thermodesulfobacteriota bacterium]
MNNFPLYDLRGVGKEFAGPTEKLGILTDVCLRVGLGESLAVIGASGSGKSTLLHLLGGLDTASWGAVVFQGRDLKTLDWLAKARLRNREIGFVFQFHHLLPEFSALENVAMPGLIAGLKKPEAAARAKEALTLVDLTGRAHHKVTTLSGGERQRAAVARAIVLRPKVLLADEPTGSLDERTGHKVGRLLLDLNKDLGMTLIVVTHNLELAQSMDRCLELRSGELHDKAEEPR